MSRKFIWNLFVDESGDFSDLQGKVVVAGVGLRLDRRLSRPDELRRKIEALVPGIVWPPHLRVIKKASALALSVMALRWRAILDVVATRRRSLRRAIQDHRDAATSGTTEPQQFLERIREVAGHGLALPVDRFVRDYERQLEDLLSAVADENASRSGGPDVPPEMWAPGELWEAPRDWLASIEASRILLEQEPKRTIRTVKALANGRDPKYNDLQLLDMILHERGLDGHLQGRVVKGIASFRRMFQTLAQVDDSGWPGAFVCLASESRPGDHNPPDSERYLSLLHAMLIRVVEALSRWRDEHTVRLHICRRLVVDPWIGGPAQVPLHVRHLGHILGSMGQDTCLTVRLVPMDIPQYRDTRDPGYVLADFFASVARGVIGNRTLERMETLLESEGGVLPRSEGRTHVQAAGTAWVMLDALRRGDQVSADERMWRWAYEQALEWGTP